MLANKMENYNAEKENFQKYLLKIKFAVNKFFKQIVKKDFKFANNNKQFMDMNENEGYLANEIEQNLANEQLLKVSQEQKQQQQPQPYVISLETKVGSFYWHWECDMQRDSFADFNFNTH